MMAQTEPVSTPSDYWRLIPGHYHEGNRIYHHARTGELAWEDPQEARLIALPPAVETCLRKEYNAEP